MSHGEPAYVGGEKEEKLVSVNNMRTQIPKNQLAHGSGTKVIINGVTSVWLPVTSVVPQGSILSPVLFNISINYLDARLEGIPWNSTKLGESVALEGRKGLQRDLDQLEDWAITNYVKFKAKCWILHETGEPWIYGQTGE
ncbi:hypothetical protein DUI87_15800 [Hirundo rustica rustica]|uniref:Uncharacterized protein n=1 Tax=Hirundo rustica rustica TaxID=333673 RepID=A0A3M0K088_HIRRU|nr:hypothetical protein DUI87_15800 [Hirundo rustica rustica]